MKIDERAKEQERAPTNAAVDPAALGVPSKIEPRSGALAERPFWWTTMMAGSFSRVTRHDV